MKFKLLTLIATFLLALPGLFAQVQMTPELLWKLGRVSLSDVSADGKTVLFTVQHYNIAENTGSSKTYALDVKSGQVTPMDLPFGAAQFLGEGRIGGIEKGQYMISTDGGKSAGAMALFKADNYKAIPLADGRIMLLFTMPYKFKTTTADVYPNLPKANAQVCDDLMYRHWAAWNDEFVNHLCYVIYEAGKGSTEPIDIMRQEPFDVPNPPMGRYRKFYGKPGRKNHCL